MSIKTEPFAGSCVGVINPKRGALDPDYPDERQRRAALGQFLTPTPVAELMASLFRVPFRDVRLLDAGAGTGALTEAFVRRLCRTARRPKTVSVTAYELDHLLLPKLYSTLEQCKYQCDEAGILFSAKIVNEDFIASVIPIVRKELFAANPPMFNAAIANPPYRKIRSDSHARLLLRSAGIETGNLYSGFVALIANLLISRGELVAITPRSFCNGPYFRAFRTEFLNMMSLRRLHVFESRSAAFSRDKVLQENIIVHAIKDESRPRQVTISSSNGQPGSSVKERRINYKDVVDLDDPGRFIHLVIDDSERQVKANLNRLPSSLDDLGLMVSTGRVVDFRARSYLRQQPDRNTVPLIYPTHFAGGFVAWPKENSRKPNAIVWCENTRELLVPAGTYVLVKRFTSKEERRRIVACIYRPDVIQSPLVGFENHLNYYHSNGQGMPTVLATGLAAFLNSSSLDRYFRQFSGHTQVNAADLRSLRYPSRKTLEELGRQIAESVTTQKGLDDMVDQKLFA